MLEFRRKFQKSSISACFLPQLPSACRNFCRNYLQLVEIWMLEFRRKMIDAGVLFRAITVNMSKFWCSGISTKLHRFRRAFCRNYLRRVKILMLEFRRKFIDFSVLFYLRRVQMLMFEFRRKIIDFCVIFGAITFGVSKY